MTPDEIAAIEAPVREMFPDELIAAMENLHQYPRLIAERAAREAVEADRERIAEAIRALPVSRRHSDDWVRRRDVYVAIEGKP